MSDHPTIGFTATIREKHTGKTGTYSSSMQWMDGFTGTRDQYDLIRYMWTDGNHGCSCNRKYAIHDEDEPGVDDIDCTEGDFIVEEMRVDEDGHLLMQQDEWISDRGW